MLTEALPAPAILIGKEADLLLPDFCLVFPVDTPATEIVLMSESVTAVTARLPALTLPVLVTAAVPRLLLSSLGVWAVMVVSSFIASR